MQVAIDFNATKPHRPQALAIEVTTVGGRNGQIGVRDERA